MKTGKFNYSKLSIALAFMLVTIFGCERDILDNTPLASFSDNPDVFIDGFSAGLDYLPYGDSFFEAFSVETNEVYEGQASMRLDIPNVGDPAGAYSGAIFRTDVPRDLTEYDALTFWAKGTRSGSINEIGFGQDFIDNKFEVKLKEPLQLTTFWRKYVIPIPDPSKLTQLTGLFWYAEGPEDGEGYSIFVDEIKYEKLGTIAFPRPEIMNGEDVTVSTFEGSNVTVTGLNQTFNLGSGEDITVAAAAGYFEFTSSNTGVAVVDEFGVVSIVGSGQSIITATLGGQEAEGSLIIQSLGDFTPAPTPTQAPENVISIFSDAYENVPVDYYNGYFAPFQTTQGQDDLNVNGDNIINYTDLNFVGVGTFLNVAPIDATTMTHFHVDINIREDIDPGDFIRLSLLNGVTTANEIQGDYIIQSNDLVGNEWLSIDVPLDEFNGLSVRDALGLIFFVSDATISEIYVDNIYYYREVLEPSPNVDDSAATEVAVPIGFESTSLTYDFLGFEGADSAIIANPDPSGINPTGNVMRSTKTPGAQFFAGTLINLDSPIDFTSSQKLRIKVWSPKVGIPIRVRLENINNSIGIELDANTTTSNQWEEMEWDFTGQTGTTDFVRVVVFFEFIPGLPGDGSTYYYDDIQIVD